MFDKFHELKKKKKIEKELPSTLFEAASLSSFMTLEQVIHSLSQGSGELALEFKKVSNQIKHGITAEKALKSMKKDSKSPVLERAVNTMLKAHEAGGNPSKMLKETAEDINETAEAIQEKSTNTAIEKYTLLLAGGGLVPMILGCLTRLVQELKLGKLGSLGMGMKESVRQAVTQNAVLGTQIYLIEYALIASVFVALQENNLHKAFIYAGVLLPASIGLFHVTKTVFTMLF